MNAKDLLKQQRKEDINKREDVVDFINLRLEPDNYHNGHVEIYVANKDVSMISRDFKYYAQYYWNLGYFFYIEKNSIKLKPLAKISIIEKTVMYTILKVFLK